jgi:hypothetical protein
VGVIFFWNKSNEDGVRLNHSTQNVKFVSLNSIVKYYCFGGLVLWGSSITWAMTVLQKKLVMAIVQMDFSAVRGGSSGYKLDVLLA